MADVRLIFKNIGIIIGSLFASIGLVFFFLLNINGIIPIHTFIYQIPGIPALVVKIVGSLGKLLLFPMFIVLLYEVCVKMVW